MNQQIASTVSGNNGESTAHELFALTDEQILEIEPGAETAVARDQGPVTREERPNGQAQTEGESTVRESSHSSAGEKAKIDARPVGKDSSTEHGTRITEHAQEPPLWLAAQMKDPLTGEEARELWNGVQQAKSEAAAYRAAFATPEDARALKELYPGGVNEARTAAERARVLDDIDRAYFGAAGKSAQEVSASREQLAQQMLREDPAAFREMVFAGLRALEEAEKGTGATSAGVAEKTVAAVFRPRGLDSNGPRDTTSNAPPSEEGGYMKSYAAFEKSANEDLERSVGAAIERTLQQALPNLKHSDEEKGAGARHGVPLHERLGLAVRQDVEAALKGDRQLSEQVAQILSGRRLDDEARAQVVRLIGERAQQLVPVAAKRVLSDWTQTTLAAHRGNTARANAASSRREVAPASADSHGASLQASNSTNSGRDPGLGANRSTGRSDARRVDYRKLSDEQILDF